MRDRASSRFDADELRRCATHLSPSAIQANEPQLHCDDGILLAVVNPVAGVRADEHGVCLGALFGDADWSTPLAPPPDADPWGRPPTDPLYGVMPGYER